MKAQPECVPCMFRQALNTVRLVTKDEAMHRRVLAAVAARARRLSFAQTPAALSQPVYEITARLTGIRDPYSRKKKESNRIALGLLPDLRRAVARSHDPLETALRAAVAGNIIDLGIGHAFDIRRDIRRIMRRPFAVNAMADFRKELRPGRLVLYLGDNAGEIVFDTLLVEQILNTGAEVIFAVKSGPIINDATMEDAGKSGMTKLTRVIETGAADIGLNWKHLSPGFRRLFRKANVVLCKGHGNFETCVGRPENLYFLLMAKCDMVARELGVKVGDVVFKHSRRAARAG